MNEDAVCAIPVGENDVKPLTDLPVTRESVPKGITVHGDGSSTEVHHGYDVLHAGPVEAAEHVCCHCGRPIRRGSISGATKWTHFPTGARASSRGWQGDRCPGDITLADVEP